MIRNTHARVLDAGCGSGAIALYTAYLGNETVGVSFESRNNEVATYRAQLLNLKNTKFIIGDLRKLDELSNQLGTFDQIVCFETIEHIMNDVKLLRDFFGVLRPGGKLFLTAPYKHYRRLPGDHITSVEDGDHVRWGYTHDEIEKLLKQEEFEVLKKEYTTGFISQTLIRFDRILSKYSHLLSWIILFPFRVLVIFDPLVTPLIKYPYLSVAIVARKK